MSGFDSPKEWREVLKETYGHHGGRLIFHLWTLAATAAALAIIGGFFIGVYRWVVQPAMTALAAANPSLPQSSGWTNVVLSLAISGLLSVAAMYRMTYWMRRTRDRDFEMLDVYFERHVWPRFNKLEQHAASVHTVKHYCQSIEKDIRELQAHTRMPPKGPPQTLGDMMSGRGIGSVGVIVDKPDSPKP